MRISYPSFAAMLSDSPADGVIGDIPQEGSKPSRYLYSAASAAWSPCVEVAPTKVAHNPDALVTNGYYLSSVTDAASSTVQSTDTLISDCLHQTVLCAPLEYMTRVGSWYTLIDSVGSTVTPISTGVSANMQANGCLKVDLDIKGDKENSLWPYGGAGFDFINNGTASTKEKTTVDVSAYDGIMITYTSTKDLLLNLGDLQGDDGAGYFITLPAQSDKTSRQILWDEFAQPEWASGSSVRQVPTKALTGIMLQYDTQDTQCSFSVYEVKFSGTGSFLRCGITPESSNKTESLAMIDDWLTKFYVENSDSTLGRIKWLSGNNQNPEVTVSEGIGYGMLLCVSAASTIQGDTYHQKFNRMFAFWNANLDEHGLMNWKVSGFSGSDILGMYSATDADIEVALSLLLAYEKFMDESYLAEARTMLTRIWNKEVVAYTVGGNVRQLLAPGDAWTEYLNPSYIDLGALYLFALYDSTHDWSTVYKDNLWLLQQNQQGSSLSLPSNWCDSSGTPVVGYSTLGYGYDACRVFARMYRAYKWTGDAAIYDYMYNVASSSVLKNLLTSSDPIHSLGLTISQNGVIGTDANSNAVASIVLPFMLTAQLGDTQLQKVFDTIKSNSVDDGDYFNLFIKSWTFTTGTNLLTRYASTHGSVVNTAYLIHIQEPDVSSVLNAIQVAFDAGNGSMKVRVKIKGTFGAWHSIDNATTISPADMPVSTAQAEAIANAVSAHATEANPHSQYLTKATGATSSLADGTDLKTITNGMTYTMSPGSICYLSESAGAIGDRVFFALAGCTSGVITVNGISKNGAHGCVGFIAEKHGAGWSVC